MQPVLYLLGITYALISAAEAQTVSLTSSIEQSGRQSACPGEVISFTCMLAGGTGIRWVAEPFISQSNPIDFAIRAATNGISQEHGEFHAVLNSVTMLEYFSANVTSTLTVRVSVILDGTVVQCTVPYEGGPLSSRSISVTSLPSPPQQLSYSIEKYSQDTFTVTIQWESPTDDEAGNTNYSYTITVTDFEPTLLLPDSVTAVTLTLSYNEVHTVSIAATNCMGTSSTSELSIYQVGCGDPIPPNSGSLAHYNSTEEGSKVSYRCNTGLTPMEQMAAVCAPNGSWNPDPATLQCRQLPPDIQNPDEASSRGLSPRAIIAITTTTSGIVSLGVGWMAGVLSYHCIRKKLFGRQRWTYQKVHTSESKN